MAQHTAEQHSRYNAHQITAVLAQIPPRRVQSQTRLKAQYGIAIQRSTLQCSAVICYAKYQRPPLTVKNQRREAAAPALQRPRHGRRALVPEAIHCAAPTPPAAHAQRTLSPRAGRPCRGPPHPPIHTHSSAWQQTARFDASVLEGTVASEEAVPIPESTGPCSHPNCCAVIF